MIVACVMIFLLSSAAIVLEHNLPRWVTRLALFSFFASGATGFYLSFLTHLIDWEGVLKNLAIAAG